MRLHKKACLHLRKKKSLNFELSCEEKQVNGVVVTTRVYKKFTARV